MTKLRDMNSFLIIRPFFFFCMCVWRSVRVSDARSSRSITYFAQAESREAILYIKASYAALLLLLHVPAQK